jgi:rifampicin phosphotransferase
VLAEVDAELRALPRLDRESPSELLALLERSAGVLRSLHGYEVLAGQLLASDASAPTAASRALEVLARARTESSGTTDAELVAEHPVLLSLLPPAIGRTAVLPPLATPRPGPSPEHRDPGPADVAVTRREALRLRIRWVHELTARAALALGGQLVDRGQLERAADVRHLRLDELRQALAGGTAIAVPASAERSVDTPLPRAFRQAGDVIVPVAADSRPHTGRGAGGGRGMGRTYQGTGPPPAGAVLVVSHLDPSLAPLLPGLSGLVAETGSVLSHLAILAREHGVPTVVDLPDAGERYPEGTWVVVDGASGEVSAVESEEWRAA